jgi:hypothetical protein
MDHGDVDSTIELCLNQRGLARFLGLLAGGVGVAVGGPCGLDAFFGEVLGLDPDYVRDRLRTIFVNGQPVDDTARAVIGPGDEVALSVAMPGLVGICMRRDSPFKSFRGDITHGRAAPRIQSGQRSGLVTLKLFNFIAGEVGPGLFARGAVLAGDRLAAALGRGDGVVRARCGGRDCDAAALATQLAAKPLERHLVRVDAAEGGA